MASDTRLHPPLPAERRRLVVRADRKGYSASEGDRASGGVPQALSAGPTARRHHPMGWPGASTWTPATPSPFVTRTRLKKVSCSPVRTLSCSAGPEVMSDCIARHLIQPQRTSGACTVPWCHGGKRCRSWMSSSAAVPPGMQQEGHGEQAQQRNPSSCAHRARASMALSGRTVLRPRADYTRHTSGLLAHASRQGDCQPGVSVTTGGRHALMTANVIVSAVIRCAGAVR
ncbi:hypothetical protein KIPE111705_27610 [Kibdelosporangium persicum]